MGNASGAEVAHTVGRALREWAASQPDAPAIIGFNKPTLSYRLLTRRIDEIRARLNFLGWGRGDRIAVVLPSGDEMAVSLLGIMDSACAVPLCATHTQTEFQTLFAELEIDVVFTKCGVGDTAEAAAEQVGLPVVKIETQRGEPAGGFEIHGRKARAVALPGRSKPKDLAIILRTAGTTSRAKIVPLNQQGIVTRAVRKADFLCLDPSDRAVTVAPFYHALGISTSVLSPLISGGSVVTLPGFTPSLFYKALEDFRPTWYSAVPAIQRAIIANAPRSRRLPGDGALRFVHFGANHAPPSIRLALERTFGVAAIESFDVSEVGALAVEPMDPGARRPGTVGRIVSPDVVAIADETGAILPPGSVGEIVARGLGVISGYGGPVPRPQGKFFDDWFRTGDMGSIDEDGFLTFRGRLDDVIGVGDRQIVLSDIDAAFEQHPAVAEAIGFTLPHPTRGEELVAAVVLEDRASISALALRRFVRSRLNPLNAPRRIEIVKELPATPLGKPIRSGLGLLLGLVDLADIADDQASSERMPQLSEIAASLRSTLGVWR